MLDRQRRTWGYELLFRSGRENTALFDDPDDATRCLVERTLLEWGLDHVLHGRVGLINVAAGFLLSGTYQVLPNDHIVLELLESIDYTAEVVAAIRRAADEGYRFALDDVVRSDSIPDDVIGLVEIVKVDVLAVDREQLAPLVASLRRRAPRAVLLAEKVEEHDDLARCAALGFDLFQGYFFAKPEVLSRAARPVNSTAALALLVEVQRPWVDIGRLEELVSGDPTLAFRLLALVNSSQTGLSSRVGSVHQAIVLLGVEQVRQLATLLTMAANSHTNPELLVLAATRARMARELAPAELTTSAFTVGLLSVIDAIFLTPMPDLIRELPLAPEVAAALLGEPSPLLELLDLIRAYEVGDVDALQRLGVVDFEHVRLAFGDAAGWADGFCRAVIGV